MTSRPSISRSLLVRPGRTACYALLLSAALHAAGMAVCSRLTFGSLVERWTSTAGEPGFELRLSKHSVLAAAPAPPANHEPLVEPVELELPCTATVPLVPEPPPSAPPEELPRAHVEDTLVAAEPVHEPGPPPAPAASAPQPALSSTAPATPVPGPAPSVATEARSDAPPGSGAPGQGTHGPRLLSGPRPLYPHESELRNEQGRVVCLLHIRGDGKVERVDVLTSSGFARLDRAAVVGLERWSFEPALEQGRAVAGELRHTVSFVLE